MLANENNFLNVNTDDNAYKSREREGERLMLSHTLNFPQLFHLCIYI